MRVLFLNDTDRVELIRALFDARHRRQRGIELVATDVSSDSPVAQVCDQFEVVPAVKDALFERHVEMIIARHGVGAVVAGSNFDLECLFNISKRMKNHGVVVFHPDREVIDLALDKRSYPKFCERYSVRTPKIFEIENGEMPAFPCIVKPARG